MIKYDANGQAYDEVRPGARLDWGVDWSQEMRTGDTITQSTWAGPESLTLEDASFSASATKVWAEGFVLGQDYTITNSIVTAQGREDSRTIVLKCREVV